MSIRRVDGLEFDDTLGVLDSDGEIGHLHKGIDNVAHLPELMEINDTTLPLYEKSLIDPESPALNEDNEFPEYDLNIVYSTADIVNVKLHDIKNKYLTSSPLPIKNQHTPNMTKPNRLNNSEHYSNIKTK